MRYQLVRFFKAAFIEQQQNALPRRELAFAVLPLAPLLAAAFFRQTVATVQFLERFSAHNGL
jgi:hypothetical protein